MMIARVSQFMYASEAAGKGNWESMGKTEMRQSNPILQAILVHCNPSIIK